MHIKTSPLKNVKTLTLVAMLIAMSAVGAMIKIYNTVAFDSLPGYFASLYFGSYIGAVVISLGHIFTALTSGFPLGIPNHIIIAVSMAVCAYFYSFAYRRFNAYAAVAIGTILNGPVATLIFVPQYGWGFFVQMVLPLTIASFANVLLAAVIYKAISTKIKR
ncbi:ECF transporter S component [Thermoanaerobacterium thermosaccharolyticum]|uniref:Putative membrane protein n=1 Tax=Thermoanaerobacterium thermosaccharolyticum M0795 TaxID=698948 RepID=L0INX0_THETR|nr:ECF transporter S component [Thermoanaerobacterium thermosaccharolyticum]AGB19911.1 putative membrane protein [Thermoanaerobacterium thermosaccharolyticum M0795]